jgi:hypothetical protein
VPPSARLPSRRRADPLTSRAHWSGRRVARRFFGGGLSKAAARSGAKKPSGALSRAATLRCAALGAAARPVRRTAPRARPTRCAHGGERAGAGSVGVWGHHTSGCHLRDAQTHAPAAMMAQPLFAPAHAATEELLHEGSLRVGLAFCRLPPDVKAALEEFSPTAPATWGQARAKTVVRRWRETKARVDGRSFVHGQFDNAAGGGASVRTERQLPPSKTLWRIPWTRPRSQTLACGSAQSEEGRAR